MFPAQSRRTTDKPTQFILLPISSIESEDKNVGNFSAKIQKIGALGREVVESSNLKTQYPRKNKLTMMRILVLVFPAHRIKDLRVKSQKKTLIQATNPAPYSNTKSKKSQR